MADDPADTSFTTALADLERDQLDTRAATAEQERDEARDDRDVLRQQLIAEKARTKHLTGRLATAHAALRNLAQAYTDATPSGLGSPCRAQEQPHPRQPAWDAVWALIAASPALATTDYARACENARVWRAVEAALDAMEQAGPCRAQGEPAEVEVVELSGAEWDAACRAGLARLGLTYAQLAEQARTGRLRDPEAIKLWPTVKGRPELDLPADSCAQGIRPADWQQNAVDAARDALTQAWGWSDDSVMPARLAEVAVSAVIDAGLAGAGGRCPTCGETYPRTMPAGEDQRCWTCSTGEVAGLPEYTGGEQSLTDRLAAALKRLMRTNAGEGVPVATWDEWEHLLAQHAGSTPPTGQTVSSVIAVPSRFARAAGAAHGQNDTRDWVRLRTGSGRQYEGHRSALCPGDGVAGHRHDVRCVDQAEG